MKIIKEIQDNEIIRYDCRIMKDDDSLFCHYIGSGFIEYGSNNDDNNDDDPIPYFTIKNEDYYLNDFMRLNKSNIEDDYFNYFDGYMTMTNVISYLIKFNPYDNEQIFLYAVSYN